MDKNECCSRSCGSALRYHKMSLAGKLVRFKQGELAAKKTKRAKRLQEEIYIECGSLEISITTSIRRLYVRARNRGYHNGFYSGCSRARRGEN